MKKTRVDTHFLFIVSTALIYSIIFTVFCILRYHALFSWENGDDAVFNQCAYNTAQGHLFFSTVKGERLLFEHVSPIIIIFGLGYRLLPSIYMWYAIANSMLALGAVFLYLLGRKILHNKTAASLISLIYLFYPPLHAMSLGVLDPEKLAIPFWIGAYLGFVNRSWKLFLACAIGAMSCKENMALLLIMFSFYSVLQRRRWTWIIFPLVLGSLWLIIAFSVVMPLLLTHTSYTQEYLRQIEYGEAGVTSMLLNAITHPQQMANLLLRIDHLRLVARLLQPLLFIPLLAPDALLIAAPTFTQFMLTPQRLTTPQDHWLTGAIPFSVIAFIIALQRIHHLASYKFKNAAALKLVLPLLVIGYTSYYLTGDTLIGELHDDYIDDTRFLSVRNQFNPEFYRCDERDSLAWQLIKRVPIDASVSANYNLLIPLSHRPVLYEYGNPKTGDNYLSTDYILLNLRETYFGGGHDIPLASVNLSPLVKLIELETYHVVYCENEFLLLSRNAPTQSATDLKPAALQALDACIRHAESLLPLRGSKETL